MTEIDLLAHVPLHAALPPTSRLGLGTARLGAFWQRRGPREGAATLATLLDGGVNLIDTADCYARGISEFLVGRAVRGREVVVMTKAGLVKTPPAVWRASAGRAEGSAVWRASAGRAEGSAVWRASAGRADGLRGLRGLLPGPETGSCFTPGYLIAAHRASVRRLGREPEVLLLHEPSADVIGSEEPAATLMALRDRGNVRAVGVSVRDEEATRAALAAPWVEVVQAPVPVLRSLAPEVAASGATVLALAVLEDGRRLTELAGLGLTGAEVAVGLARAAAAQPGVDGVLLGMSRPANASANLAALALPTPAILRSALSGVDPVDDLDVTADPDRPEHRP